MAKTQGSKTRTAKGKPHSMAGMTPIHRKMHVKMLAGMKKKKK